MKSFPRVIIFDVDGVLVDTRQSFQRTTLETVQFFVGKKVSHRALHRWKNRPGFNDDWKLSTAWVNALGKEVPYDEVKKKFVEIYWGSNGKGNAAREKWLLPPANLRRLAKLAELNVFTGRVRRELDYTLRSLEGSRFLPKDCHGRKCEATEAGPRWSPADFERSRSGLCTLCWGQRGRCSGGKGGQHTLCWDIARDAAKNVANVALCYAN